MRNTFRIPLIAVALMVAGCGGKVVSAVPFDDEGRAVMEIEKTRWEGQSLWIAFEMDCPYEMVEGIGDKKEREAVYDFQGTFVMKDGEHVYNDETLHLSSTKFPVHNSPGMTYASSGGSSCTDVTGRCDLKGRIRVLELDHIEPGTKLQIEATLPDEAGDATLGKADLQFRSK